ncbi:MAG: peptidase M20 [Clostridia bacterium]|nr:peptidase M20 [Clostridia bacterium]
MNKSMSDEMVEVTKQLVAVNSINSIEGGEAKAAALIDSYFKALPYFKEHPEYSFTQDLKNDALHRKNVFAFVKGTMKDSKDVIIIHGHMDTVGVDDYGALKEYAFSCDKLKAELLKIKDSLSEDFRKDLESGDWMVGRGVGDMKSGVALFMVLTRYFSERTDELGVNILFMSNPVEENLHTGIINSLDVLNKMKAEGYNFLYAINSDCVTPLYPGDSTRYIYTGAIGKILPCFYINGMGSPVSEVASRIVTSINLNPDFCDGEGDEVTTPPAVLKMRCRGDSAYIYFNYMIMYKDTKEILSLLKEAAHKAGEDYEVYEFMQLYDMAKEKCTGDFEKYIDNLTVQIQAEFPDKRDSAYELTKRLFEMAKIDKKSIVVFLAAPYCPHNTLNMENPKEAALQQQIEKVLDKAEKETDEKFKILKFFACLTDSSYLKIDDDSDAIKALKGNFPNMDLLFFVPLQLEKELDIPALNFGVFMKDPHQWSERLYVPYSFGVLPRLIIDMVKESFN